MWCRCVWQFPGCTVLPYCLCCSFVFMIEHVMPLCLSVSRVYIVAILCVLQVCVHDRACDAAVSDNFLGVQCCHAGAEHCLWEGTPSQRGKVSSENPVSSSPYMDWSLVWSVLDYLWNLHITCSPFRSQSNESEQDGWQVCLVCYHSLDQCSLVYLTLQVVKMIDLNRSGKSIGVAGSPVLSMSD